MARARKTAITHPVTFQLWNDVVAPVIAWADAEFGRRGKITDEILTVIAPETVTRQMVESWIATNPEKRTEPTLGNALALVKAARALGVEIKTEILN